jgi:hypothetical protein
MIGFIDTLHSLLRTTINYSAIAISTLYSSLLQHLSVLSLSQSSLFVSWQRTLTKEVQQSHCRCNPYKKPTSHSLIPFLPPPSAAISILILVKATLRLTVGQSISLGVESHLGLMTRYLLLFDSYGLVFVRRSLLVNCAVNTVLQHWINTQQYRKRCFLWIRPEPI